MLEFLAQSNRGFSISEMSRKLGIPKSSTHLILGTLERRGFLRKNIQNGRYCFGLGLVGLSRNALENLDLREAARPFLRSLVQKTGLTAHMAVLERSEVVIIEKIQPPGAERLATWIGRRLDVNCTGVGKALLAGLSQDEFERVIRARSFARHNSQTVISVNALKQEIARVRQLGYAFDDEEDEVGIRCVGALIFGEPRKGLAAISVAGRTSQIPDERVPFLANTVIEMAARISEHLAKSRKFVASVGVRDIGA